MNPCHVCGTELPPPREACPGACTTARRPPPLPGEIHRVEYDDGEVWAVAVSGSGEPSLMVRHRRTDGWARAISFDGRIDSDRGLCLLFAVIRKLAAEAGR